MGFHGRRVMGGSASSKENRLHNSWRKQNERQSRKRRKDLSDRAAVRASFGRAAIAIAKADAEDKATEAVAVGMNWELSDDTKLRLKEIDKNTAR